MKAIQWQIEQRSWGAVCGAELPMPGDYAGKGIDDADSKLRVHSRTMHYVLKPVFQAWRVSGANTLIWPHQKPCLYAADVHLLHASTFPSSAQLRAAMGSAHLRVR